MINFKTTSEKIEVVNHFFYLKIIDILAINFIKISRIEIFGLGLA